MSKILEAIRSMIDNEGNISDVLEGEDGEYFFLYNGKFAWSMIKNKEGDLSIYYYPNVDDPKELVSIIDWEGTKYVANNSGNKDPDKLQVYEELYALLAKKVFDFDKVLDEIILF